MKGDSLHQDPAASGLGQHVSTGTAVGWLLVMLLSLASSGCQTPSALVEPPPISAHLRKLDEARVELTLRNDSSQSVEFGVGMLPTDDIEDYTGSLFRTSDPDVHYAWRAVLFEYEPSQIKVTKVLAPGEVYTSPVPITKLYRGKDTVAEIWYHGVFFAVIPASKKPIPEWKFSRKSQIFIVESNRVKMKFTK